MIGQTYTVTVSGYSDNNSYRFFLNGVELGTEGFINGVTEYTYTFTATGTDTNFAVSGIGAISQTPYTVSFELDTAAPLVPRQGDDTLFGTEFADTIDLLGGNDIYAAGEGYDNVRGGDGDDTIEGEGGNDIIFGENGADDLFGGDGRDSIRGGNDADLIEGGAGIDRIWGDVGNDDIDGGSDDDILDGGAGDDAIAGGLGNDAIRGGNNNNAISGGAGRDKMSGGAGSDTFVFETGHGADTIRDFDVAEDVLDFTGIIVPLDSGFDGPFDPGFDGPFPVLGFEAYAEYATQDGANVVFTIDGGDSVTLLNTNLEDLSADNFVLPDIIFVPEILG